MFISARQFASVFTLSTVLTNGFTDVADRAISSAQASAAPHFSSEALSERARFSGGHVIADTPGEHPDVYRLTSSPKNGATRRDFFAAAGVVFGTFILRAVALGQGHASFTSDVGETSRAFTVPIIDWSRATRDPAYLSDVLRWVVTEKSWISRTRRPSTIPSLDDDLRRLQNMPSVPGALWTLFTTDMQASVRREALTWLAEIMNASPKMSEELFEDGSVGELYRALENPELASPALSILKIAMAADQRGTRGYFQSLLQESDFSRLRNDSNAAGLIESALNSISNPEFLAAYARRLHRDSPSLSSFFRRLTYTGFPSSTTRNSPISINTMQAAHWPYLRDYAFLILDNAVSSSESVKREYVDLLLELKAVSLLGRDGLLESQVTRRLDWLASSATGVSELVEVAADKSAWHVTRSRQALSELSKLPFLDLPGGDDFNALILNIVELLDDPDKSADAEKLITLIPDQALSPGQMLEIKTHRERAAKERLRHRRFLSDLRTLILDPQATFASDPDDSKHPNRTQYIRDSLNEALSTDKGWIVQLFLEEKDREAQITLIKTIAEAPNHDALHYNWEAAHRFLDILNPDRMSEYGEQADTLRPYAAYALADSWPVNPFFIETAGIVLKLKATGPILTPGGLPVRNEKQTDLLDQILFFLAPRDVLQAYLSTSDEDVKTQAVIWLASARDSDLALAARPEVLPALLNDLENSIRRPYLATLLISVTDVQYHRVMTELLVVDHPELLLHTARESLYDLELVEWPPAVRSLLNMLVRTNATFSLTPKVIASLTSLLFTEDGREVAERVLMRGTLTADAREAVLAEALHQITTAEAVGDSRFWSYYVDLVTRLIARSDFARSLVTLWQHCLDPRLRAAAFHWIAAMNSTFLLDIPGATEDRRKIIEAQRPIGENRAPSAFSEHPWGQRRLSEAA